jgi:predicted Zn-dependent peptidase
MQSTLRFITLLTIIVSVFLTSCDTGVKDPIDAKIYTLDNGLTVYLSVNKDAPRINTAIAVRAGSKNDPADATGLAHYLEHLMFKGTPNYGTKDWEKEKVEIAKIIDLFETYRQTTDPAMRKKIYAQIDSISYVASQYAIPNEYDKMVSAIGAKGTNAYTWIEQTVYINDIPSNQVDKWLELERERFSIPVQRLFHTELEIVYEEKNRGLDSDGRKVYEAMNRALFKNHQYGTQSTIGTIEHLKSPSMKKVEEYYYTYYVPNNMAICLAGDFDPETVLAKIKETFGTMEHKEVPVYNPPVEDPITEVRTVEVLGPDAESVRVGFRLPGDNTREADLLTMMDMVLSNSQAGLIDLNLNQQQKVIGGFSSPYIWKDYSQHIFGARPRQGQSLEEVRDLLLGQIELVKKGEFPDWLPEAIVNDLKLSEIRSFDSNGGRTNAFVNAFIKHTKWEDVIGKMDRLAKITKKDIVDFANKYYSDNNYAVVYKRVGKDDSIIKVTKPEITEVKLDRDSQSQFVTDFMAKPTKDIAPVFIDYKNEITFGQLNKDVEVLHKANNNNDLFSLYYIADMGRDNFDNIGYAMNYLNYLGTSKYSPSELKQEFYKIGCDISVSSGDDQSYVVLTGLKKNFKAGVKLLEHLLADAQANEEALVNMKSDIKKQRANNKLDKGQILFSGMLNYGIYGPKSSFTNRLSNAEMDAITSAELLEMIHSLTQYPHRVLYYGPQGVEQLSADLNELHKLPDTWKEIPEAKNFVQMETKENQIYLVNYDMQQAEILMLSRKDQFDPALAPIRRMFNEYYGGSMSSVVFQTMREQRALAYSVFASYRFPEKAGEYDNVLAYIGTQADKVEEAMAGYMDLLKNMPKSEKSFDLAKEAILKQIQTERITKTSVLFNYENAKKLGLDYDLRKPVYEQVPDMKIDDIEAFFNDKIRGTKYNIMVLGDLKKIDRSVLAKYGDIQELTLEELFGY